MKFFLEALFEQWILVLLAGAVIGIVSWLRGKGKEEKAKMSQGSLEEASIEPTGEKYKIVYSTNNKRYIATVKATSRKEAEEKLRLHLSRQSAKALLSGEDFISYFESETGIDVNKLDREREEEKENTIKNVSGYLAKKHGKNQEEIEKEFRSYMNGHDEGSLKSSGPKAFTILGKEFAVEHYPVLYRWAQSNPDTLEERLKDLADKVYGGNIGSAAQALESDLEHGG